MDPQQWNLYSYCGNNPTSYFDPDGRDRGLYIHQLHLLRIKCYGRKVADNMALADGVHGFQSNILILMYAVNPVFALDFAGALMPLSPLEASAGGSLGTIWSNKEQLYNWFIDIRIANQRAREENYRRKMNKELRKYDESDRAIRRRPHIEKLKKIRKDVARNIDRLKKSKIRL